MTRPANQRPITEATLGGRNLTEAIAALNTGQAVVVDQYRQAGDPDDTAAWRRAVADAITRGRPVSAPSRTYTLSDRVDVVGANGLVVSGAGAEATILNVSGATTTLQSLFWSSGACTDVVFQDMTVRGTQVDDTNGVPRRSRTHTGNGLNTAFLFAGDARPGFETRPVVRNIKLRRVRIQHTRGLPFWFDGVRGFAGAYDVDTLNTMDAGFTWCEHVVGDNFTSTNSADNGISISRGCKRVTFGQISVTNAAYFGVWVAGWVADPANLDPSWTGPQDFSIDTINVVTAGKGGVQLDDAPQNGRIGNIYVRDIRRGPSDEPSNINCVGIRVGGFPASNRQAVTAYAKNIRVDNALLINCARGGVAVSGAQDVTFGSVTVVNAGTPFLADGTTAIPSSQADQNFGLAVEPGAESSVTRLVVNSLRVVDTRATPSTSSPYYVTGSVSPEVRQASAFGTRNPIASADNTGDVYGGTKTFSGNTKLVGGATAGSNAATGVVASLAVNGAAGSTRPLEWLTASAVRWRLQAGTAAETGANTGSDLEFVSRTDAGGLLHTFATLVRASGVWRWGRATSEARVAQTLAAAGAVTIDAASGNHQYVTLNASATAVTITNPTQGQTMLVSVYQGAAGSAFPWPSNVKLAGAALPLSTTAGWRDNVTLTYDGTNWNETARALGIR